MGSHKKKAQRQTVAAQELNRDKQWKNANTLRFWERDGRTFCYVYHDLGDDFALGIKYLNGEYSDELRESDLDFLARDLHERGMINTPPEKSRRGCKLPN